MLKKRAWSQTEPPRQTREAMDVRSGGHTWQDRRVISGYKIRRAKEKLIAGLVIACVGIIMIPLLDIVFMFGYNGILSISIPRLLQTTGTEQQGLANALVGTLLLVTISALVAVPVGVIGGIYLAEFSGQSRFAEGVRFIADVLAGMPSILLGYLGLLVLDIYFGWGIGSGGSVLAGGLTLSVLMLPYIMRTTELSLRKVPRALREAAIALGSTKTQMINRLTLSLALPGIVTGIILAMSISIGETAPLLYTAGNSNYYPCGIVHCPTSYLTYIIWIRAVSANTFDPELAYLSAFLLMSIVVGLNVLARIGLKRMSRV